MDFEFVEIKPTRTRGNKEHLMGIVRTSFIRKKDSFSLTLYIGKNIAKKLALDAGNKVSISYDKNNPKIWFIRKIESGSGYKLVDVISKSGTPSSSLRLQLTWNKAIFKPKDEEVGIREVGSEIYEEGILIRSDETI